MADKKISDLTAKTYDQFFPADLATIVQAGTNHKTTLGDLAQYKRVPYGWWIGAGMPLAVPTGVWTPLAWTINGTDPWALDPGLTASTTIAGGESDVLPTATISLTDASAFASSGFVLINGPPGASTYTIVGYTGKSSNNLTGCNTAPNASISTGTLAAGQVVTQCFVEYGALFTPGLWNVIAEVAWASHATGYRGVRQRGMDGVFDFPIATTHNATLTLAFQNQQVSCQPAFGVPNRVEVFQNSGGVLNTVSDGIQAPSLMAGFMTLDF